MNSKNECKGCRRSVRHPFDEVKEKMEEFLLTIPEEEKVSQPVYNMRMSECRQCSGLYYDTTCKYCGCFVQMRAMRKNKDCPHPGKSKWNKADDSER
ncbi:MAG: DUF6171 family protein [Clostridia bacterium]|nr:DUF6171 family protein [Clostridia bacterium]